MASAQSFVVNLRKVDEDALLYGKLGSELSILSSLKINIPDGFIVTTDSYFEFLKENNLQQKIKHLFTSHNDDEKSLKKVAEHIKNTILESDMPQSVLLQIFRFYRSLGWQDKRVTLTPSSTDSYLRLPPNTEVKGEAVVIQDIKDIWTKYFEYDLLAHRHRLGLSHFKAGIAVIVQRELYSGNSGFIENGQITARKKLTPREEKELLDIGKKITDIHFFPKKTHWIISQGKTYITKLSPTVENLQTGVEKVEIPTTIPPLYEAATPRGRIATGVVKIIKSKKDIENIQNGEIVILQNLKSYDDIKAIRHAKALVVEQEINNQHINSILSRMGLPVVVDENVKHKLRNGMIVTVDASRGQAYAGGFRVN